jgi:hypothetical protein
VRRVIGVGRGMDDLKRVAGLGAEIVEIVGDRGVDTAVIGTALGGKAPDLVLDFLWGGVAEAAFAALRDGRPTAIDAVEDRRQHMEDNVFAVLEDNGVVREELVLAFDFVTQSEYQLTHQMLSMRDQAFAWLEQVEGDPEEITFTVTTVVDHDCGMPGQVVWRDVQGTYQSPLFLENDPDDAEAPIEPPAQFLRVDENDEPVQNGFMSSPFDISIPCNVLEIDGPDVYPLVLGHGLFGTGASMTLGIPPTAGAIVDEWSYIAGATLWRGLSAPDRWRSPRRRSRSRHRPRWCGTAAPRRRRPRTWRSSPGSPPRRR